MYDLQTIRLLSSSNRNTFVEFHFENKLEGYRGQKYILGTLSIIKIVFNCIESGKNICLSLCALPLFIDSKESDDAGVYVIAGVETADDSESAL